MKIEIGDKVEITGPNMAGDTSWYGVQFKGATALVLNYCPSWRDKSKMMYELSIPGVEPHGFGGVHFPFPFFPEESVKRATWFMDVTDLSGEMAGRTWTLGPYFSEQHTAAIANVFVAGMEKMDKIKRTWTAPYQKDKDEHKDNELFRKMRDLSDMLDKELAKQKDMLFTKEELKLIVDGLEQGYDNYKLDSELTEKAEEMSQLSWRIDRYLLETK